VGKPECEAHALFGDHAALNRLLHAYRMRASLVKAEFG
jgi:hypothetical protein